MLNFSGRLLQSWEPGVAWVFGWGQVGDGPARNQTSLTGEGTGEEGRAGGLEHLCSSVWAGAGPEMASGPAQS